eukprot:403334598
MEDSQVIDKSTNQSRFIGRASQRLREEESSYIHNDQSVFQNQKSYLLHRLNTQKYSHTQRLDYFNNKNTGQESYTLDDESAQMSGLESPSDSPQQDHLDLSLSLNYGQQSFRSRKVQQSSQKKNESQNQEELNFYSTHERDAYMQSQLEIKNLNLKIRQLKIDMKDLHSRLKRSEAIKVKSLQELERLECENQLISDDNKELQSKFSNQDAEIKFLRAQNAKLKSYLKDKAFEQNDFLLGIDDSLMQNIDESFSESLAQNKDYQSGRNVKVMGKQYTQDNSPVKSKMDNQQQLCLEEIKKTLDLLAGQSNNSDSAKGDQGTIKSAQEVALLKQKLQLLEQNNKQLSESKSFQNESYQKLNQDYNHLKEKYLQLKENHSALQEQKDRVEMKVESLQNQLNQMLKERDTLQYGQNVSSGMKPSQQQSQMQTRNSVRNSSNNLFTPSPNESKGNFRDLNFHGDMPQQSLRDENLKQKQSPTQKLPTNLNAQVIQDKSVQELIQMHQEINKPEQTSQSIKQDDQNDLAKQNNLLLNMILSKLNADQNQNIAASKIDEIKNSLHNTHQKHNSTNSQNNSTTPSQRILEASLNNHSSQNSSRRSGQLNGSNGHQVQNAGTQLFDGNIFPTLGNPNQSKHQFHDNISTKDVPRNFNKDQMLQNSRIVQQSILEDPSFVEEYNMLIEQTSSQRLNEGDQIFYTQNLLEPIDEDQNDELNFSNLTLQNYFDQKPQIPLNNPKLNYIDIRSEQPRGNMGNLNNLYDIDNVINEIQLENVNENYYSQYQSQQQQFINPPPQRKYTLNQIQDFDIKSTKSTEESNLMRYPQHQNSQMIQNSRNSFQQNMVKSQPTIKQLYDQTTFKSVLGGLYSIPFKSNSGMQSATQLSQNKPGVKSKSRNQNQKSVNTTLLLRQSIVGNYLLNYQNLKNQNKDMNHNNNQF